MVAKQEKKEQTRPVETKAFPISNGVNPFLDGIACGLIKVFAAFLRVLPFKTALALGRFLGRLVFYLSPRRKVAYSDLKAAFGGKYSERERWRIVRKHYRNHGQMFVEILLLPRLDRNKIDERVDVPRLQHFLDIVAENRGVVLITGHFGNWELLQTVSGILGKPVNVLARNQKFPKLDNYLNELREVHGSVAIKRGMGIRELLKSLKRSELIGVLGDQDAKRDQGLIMRFLGRKTTVPTGAFELASRTNSPVLPCFIYRTDKEKHQIHVDEPIECGEVKEGSEDVLREKVQTYLDVLEKMIAEHPEEWLWETKRWKFSWTKRILVLSDRKPGHEKQSEAVAAQFKKLETQYGRAGMEYPTQKIYADFKSEAHKRLFAWISWMMIPWSHGNLGWLRFFFRKEVYKELLNVSADFIISAGSSMVGLNLCLAKDARAKSIVLMKPSFPFNLFQYDLVIVPMHDKGRIPKREFRTLLTPNQMTPEMMTSDLKAFEGDLKNPKAIRMAVFLGGSTKHFVMDHTVVEKIFSTLKKEAQSVGDYVVTTSRRTPENITQFLKKRLNEDPACQMLVVASEDSRSEIVGGMMALADILIVTEDSVSMVSEAVSSGKKVVVINLDSKALPEKHKRFMGLLNERKHIYYTKPEGLLEAIRKVQEMKKLDIFEQESKAMQEQLQEIL